MTTMTIHVEDTFAEALRAYARSVGTSVNKVVKELLAPILGVAEGGVSDNDNPYMKFCGVIPKEETRRLGKSLAEQRKIDEEMWK